MPVQINEKKAEASLKTLQGASHALVLMPKAKVLHAVPGKEQLAAVLKRKEMKAEELAKTPLAIETGAGVRVFAMLDAGAESYSRHAQLRQALAPLLSEHPTEIHIALFGADAFKQSAAQDTVYCAARERAAAAGEQKRQAVRRPAKTYPARRGQRQVRTSELALAEGNYLTRSLTTLSPNELTPGVYGS